MGPFDDIGPYAETVMTTRKTDAQAPTDNKPGIADVLIGLLLLCPAILALSLMGLFLLNHIGPIILYGIIGLCFWACARFGNNKRLIKFRGRRRLSVAERNRVERRLLDSKIRRRLLIGP